MKRLVTVTILAAALLPGAAWAQGNSQGNAPDSPPGQENRPDDPPGLEDSDDPPPGMSNRPDMPSGLDDVTDAGPASPSSSGGGAPALATTEEDRALEAVRTGRAVPLDRVLSQARSVTGGDLIDTRLLTVEGFLLYELRMLLPDGTVDRLYYYASTGNPVTTR